MNGQVEIIAAQPHPNACLALDSTLIEKALEFQLLGAVMAKFLRRGDHFELLHGICDRDGYDVVIDACGVMRHIQLKAMVEGGKRARIGLHTGLARKSSGCAVLMIWDPATVQIKALRFFGDEPGKPLPDLGERTARNSRGNSHGKKGERPAHREIPISWFKPVDGVEGLTDRLFGPMPTGGEGRP